MGAIESIKYNYGFLRTLMGSGRERYFAATHTLVKIEKEYRQFKSDSKSYHSHDVEHELAKIHTKAASMVANLCRENGAMWVKFALFLSCRPDILPLQFIAPLQSLQCEAKSAHFEEIHPLIIESWGQSWDDHFRSFDAVPVATASVAQVHRAVLRSGQEVAVKLQLPNARTYFEQDSLVFTTLARALGPLVKELDVQQVVAQLLSLTLEELDFAREAENLRQFRSLAHLPGIVTPALVEELSGQKIMVTSWAEGTPLADYLRQNPDRAIPLLNKIQAELQPGYKIEKGGELESSAKAQGSLFAYMPLAFALIILVLVAQFDSFKRPLIILLTIPLVITGVSLTLFIAPNANFGFMAILGLLALAGIVINNAIVLIDRIEGERNEGVAVREAILNASVTRLKPILMTTATTVFGLMPIIIARDVLFYDLALVISGGMIAGTVLTLGVVPVLYSLFFKD